MSVPELASSGLLLLLLQATGASASATPRITQTANAETFRSISSRLLPT
jgi:hypothetical protein